MKGGLFAVADDVGANARTVWRPS